MAGDIGRPVVEDLGAGEACGLFGWILLAARGPIALPAVANG
jgi:hypothetical protein